MPSYHPRLTDHKSERLAGSEPGSPGQAGLKRSAFVNVSLRAGVLTVIPTGPKLGEREAPIVSAEALQALQGTGGRVRAVVLDVSDVQMMTSFGLGMCIDLRNAAKAISARTIVYGLSDELHMLFKLMKVDRLYTIVRNAADLERA